MLPEDYNYNKTYIFYVQNPDDFYNQLRAFEQEHNLIDQTVDENTDLTMAQEMLQAIGIATK
jgi:hypothetical protein